MCYYCATDLITHISLRLTDNVVSKVVIPRLQPSDQSSHISPNKGTKVCTILYLISILVFDVTIMCFCEISTVKTSKNTDLISHL